jgi:AmiR/NasT family two-component response regulator
METSGARRSLRILVAEDQAIVAMALEDELGDAGHQVIGPFPTCAEASRWLHTDTPDFAVLDWELADGPCRDVALELGRRGVRFAVFSASGQTNAPRELSHVPWFDKPSDLAKLTSLIRTL